MKVIIIGSKGFIGQYLFNHFHGKGYDVLGADVVINNLSTEKYFMIDPHNIDYNAVFQYQAFDLCINCSGAASVPDSLIDPLHDYFLNTVNVFKILDSIRRLQPSCKFINLSSAAVYGNPQHVPVKESDDLRPLSPYGFHKFQSEQLCKEFWTFFGIHTCSIRIFSVYGPGLKKQLFWDLYNKMKTGVPFILYGTGYESRDFIYVLDLVEAIELVSEKSLFEAEVINIANGKEIMIKDAVSIFCSYFKNDITYSFSGEVREGDPVNWMADISKLNSFGYRPSVDIKTGLYKYYEWISLNSFD